MSKAINTFSSKNGSACVYRAESDGDVHGQTRPLYRVFDHGGDHLDSFEAFGDALQYAQLYVRFLDAGGYSDTAEAAAMGAWSQEHSHYSLA